MTRKPSLRAVTEEDAPPPPPKSLKEAAERSEVDLLKMMRAKIAAEIDGGVPPHTLAPLYRQLRDIDKELRAIMLANKREGGDAGLPGDEDWNAEAL